MSKPWEETWTVRGSAVQADGRDVLDAWYRGDDPVGGDARARLAAAAPDLVRALLRVEWGGDQSIGVCPDCDARELHGHADGCGLAAALRKARVIE